MEKRAIPAQAAGYPKEFAPRGAGNQALIYPARFRRSDDSTTKFQLATSRDLQVIRLCTSFRIFESY